MSDKVESVQDNSNAVYGDVSAAPASEAAAVAEETKSSILDLIQDSELKNHQSLHNFKDVDSLAKSFINAQSLVGKRVADMTPEEMSQYNSKLGIPSDHLGYEMEASEDLKREAFGLGLTREQAEKFANWRSEEASRAESVKLSAHEERIKAYTAELEESFGNELAAKVDLARKAAERLGGEELLKTVFSKNDPAHPAFIKALAAAGAEFSDHSSVHGQVRQSFSLTPGEAEAKIAERRRDPAFMRKAFDQHMRREDNAAWKELEHLYKLAKQQG